MNMIYKNDTLYIDIVTEEDFLYAKRKMFSVLNQYEVDNVVIKVEKTLGVDGHSMNDLVNEYHKKYKGKMYIDIN